MQNDYDLTSLGYFVRYEPCQSQPKWLSILKLFLFYPMYYVYAGALFPIFVSYTQYRSLLNESCTSVATTYSAVLDLATITYFSTSETIIFSASTSVTFSLTTFFLIETSLDTETSTTTTTTFPITISTETSTTSETSTS
jgi:hypothetical protein